MTDKTIKDEFREMTDRYLALVSRTSYRILCDRVDSEYVTCSVFISLWNDQVGSGNSEISREMILYRTCRFCRRRLFRRRILRLFSINPDIFVKTYPAVSSADDYVARQAWAVYCRAADNYSDRERIVFTLYELEGLDTEEVMRITSLAKTSVEDALEDARIKVREELDHYGRIDDYDAYIGFLRKIQDQLTDFARLKHRIFYKISRSR